ncbi:Dabb family protein [Microbacterium hibisci]|uniref:Dabb family protein n=1 Tax=Microbacterium hibisci TaxID=2036000 RepID=UPI0019424969|nr:Dabb family protein [Microbacterium hibisci]
MTAIMHVVLVAFAPDATATQRDGIRDALRRLPETVPGILDLAEGPSVSPEGLEDGFDFGFTMRFASPADRDAYLAHPDHQRFGGSLGALAARIAVFDLAVR